MDQAEARDVADGFLKEQSLPELYDRVFVPALTMAEHDRHKGALDATREAFVFLSIKEMIAEFSDLAGFGAEDPEVRRRDPAAARLRPPVSAFRGRVLCVSANDEADEISAAMLAQLLEKQGISAISFPAEEKIQEMFSLLDPQPEDVICLSALPPFAFAQARSAARQFRSKFPKTPLIVGVWGFSGDIEKALARFHEPRPDKLVTSFADAVTCINVPGITAAGMEG
jgi:hypothetical protein